MSRLWVLAGFFAGTAVLAACGTTDDDRPTTIEYVVSSVLAPNCANAQCHSAFRQVKGYAFDTPEHLKASGDVLVTKGEPELSSLYLVLTPEGVAMGFPQMPYDQPLPNADIELVRRWIAEGADGL
ncbi:MAG: hypothetical protein KF773_25775 [Deltaproteobacteria bacterium]|nr:hypothetical protein [Deltaproteobacteria bacterium]